MGMTTVKILNKEHARNLKGKTDWKKLEQMSDADIQKATLSDPDAPPSKEYELTQFRPFIFLRKRLRF